MKKPDYNHRLICFDIETTKDCDPWGNDLLYTWHWQAMFQDDPQMDPVYITWQSWPECLSGLLSLCEGKKTICFVHNLSYETEAIIRNLSGHTIDNIFATDTHKMLKFTLDNLLEFRCSYYLTNKSLAQCGKDVKMKKLDMEYNIKRRPGDYISPEEESYCRRDVEIMIYKIRQLEKQEGLNFWDFPLTNTGFLRNELRKAMKADPANHKLFRKSRMDAEQFMLCRDAFMGGYTHANYMYAGQVVEGVDSNDFGSAYPFDILVHRYPMGKWHWVKNPSWRDVAFMRRSEQNMLFIGEFQFIAGEGEKVVARGCNTYLSMSKCICTDDVIEDNGRIQSATMIHTTCTCLDLEIILRAYTVKRIRVIKLIWARSGYLPDVLIKTMLKYYEQKQALKKIKGEEDNYMKAKNRVNSFYGMMVTSPLHDEIELSFEQWTKKRLDYTDTALINEKLNTFYDSYNSFLPYQWGVFVPAWTRYHLWLDVILPNDKRIVYCDTDSAKTVQHDLCQPSFDKYNAWANDIRRRRLRDLDIEKDFPDLGVFDWETESGAYWGFLTWGAKKYLVQDNYGMFHATVAGLSKKAGQYIRYWSDFQPGTIFAPDISGRTISKYCNNGVQWGSTYFAAECSDADGILSGYLEIQDGGGCRIENTTYRLSVSESYEMLLATDGLDAWREQNSDLMLTKNERIHVSRPEIEKDTIDFEIIKDKRNLYKVNFR